MGKNISLSIIFMMISILAAQAITISGKVVDDTNGKPIDNALCSVSRGKGAPVAYMFTDEQGKFSLQAAPTDSVSFSHIGYAKLTMVVKAVGQNSVIRLTPAEFSLREITVKAPPIRENGDTLVYDVNSFKTESDRYISDVLKKLPGVTVEENGAIKYQGKPINKFYIEGRDLLEGRYTIASNNLDVNAVKKVEVIEHNQHIKSLQGLEPAERAAINLKLDKQFMVRPFGELKGSIGNGPVYDAALTTMLLTRGPQAIVTLQANNNGKMLESEANDKFDMTNFETYIAPYSPLISLPSTRSLSLPSNRYTFNRSRLASINLLLPTVKDSELKINAVYAADRLRQSYSSRQSIMMGQGGTLNLFENALTHRLIDKVRANVLYELNSSKLFLRDEAGFLSNRRRGSSTMMTQSDSVDNTAGNYPKEMFNKFSTIIRSKRSQVISFSSQIRAAFADENLEATFPTIGAEVNEKMKVQRFSTRNYLSTSVSLFSHRIGLGGFINYDRMRPRITVNSIGLDIPDEILPAAEGIKSSISNLEYGINPDISFRWNDGDLRLSFHPGVRGFDVRAVKSDVRHHSVKFLPTVSFRYKPNVRLEMNISGRRSFSYQGERPFYPAPYMTTYRSVYVPSGDLNYTESYSASYSLGYKHSVKLLFANLSVNYSTQKRNFTSSSYNTDDWSCYTTILRPNRSNTLSINGEISKSFANINTTVRLTPGVSFTSSDVFQQNIMSRNHYSSYNFDLRLTNRSLAWLYAQYALTGGIFRNSNKTFNSSTLTNWFHTIDLSFYPIKKLTIDFLVTLSTLDNYTSGHKNFAFCDIGATYTIKRASFTLSGRNLTNQRDYSISTFSSVNETSSSLPLRGREISAGIKLKF
ncbi:MAG: TonB-dependent receptor [Muribaculum sp.]|nr:TonB-dependent receptor [Muribaculum sp.]